MIIRFNFVDLGPICMIFMKDAKTRQSSLLKLSWFFKCLRNSIHLEKVLFYRCELLRGNSLNSYFHVNSKDTTLVLDWCRECSVMWAFLANSRLIGQNSCWLSLLWLALNIIWIFSSNEISVTFVLIFQVKKSFFEHKRVSRLSSHHRKIETENLHCLVGAAWRKNRNYWCHEACWAQEFFLKY